MNQESMKRNRIPHDSLEPQGYGSREDERVPFLGGDIHSGCAMRINRRGEELSDRFIGTAGAW